MNMNDEDLYELEFPLCPYLTTYQLNYVTSKGVTLPLVQLSRTSNIRSYLKYRKEKQSIKMLIFK